MRFQERMGILQCFECGFITACIGMIVFDKLAILPFQVVLRGCMFQAKETQCILYIIGAIEYIHTGSIVNFLLLVGIGTGSIPVMAAIKYAATQRN